MPNALFRAAAVAMPTHGNTLSFAVFGGHHLCEAAPDGDDDDGGCDEIRAVRMFADAVVPPVFALEADPDVPAVERAAVASIQTVVVSPLPALTGFRLQGAVTSGGGFWTTKTTLDVARSDFHVRHHCHASIPLTIPAAPCLPHVFPTCPAPPPPLHFLCLP